MAKPIPAQNRFEPDENQRRAIEHVHGPLLVVAGAGTGKTTVLTQRVARLIRSGAARPEEILAVTYTKNAAMEMHRRVQGELRGTDLSGLRTVTFHKYCDDLLRSRGRGFEVLDDKDLWIFLRRRIRELHLKCFIRAANVSKFLDDLLEFMRRCQDELVGPEKYAEYVERLHRGELPIPRVCRSKDVDALSDEEVLNRCGEIARVFASVERMLKEQNLGTFGHMITRAYELLQSDPELRSEECRRTRFILIDEFQDANFAQVKILRDLAGEERNVFAVGDPDQAIYQFRGASSAAFTLFQRAFPGARLVVLEKNRRSTTPILQSAFALINKNPNVSVVDGTERYQRSPLVSAREEDAVRDGTPIASLKTEAVLLTAKEVECSDLVTTIRERKRKERCSWSDFAVLYRIHSHRDQLAAELGEEGIPFSIENMDVLDSPEVRDLMACMGAIVTDEDGASLFRVSALPQFSVDPQKLRAGMRALPRDCTGAGMAIVLGEIEGGSAVLQTIRETRKEIADAGAKAHDALRIILRRFLLPLSPPVKAVLEFVAEWEKKVLTKTGELVELLEYLEYFRQARGVICLPARDEDAVHLMTVHTAKGLEWNHVFILRANSNSFPSSYKEHLVEFPPELRDADSAGEDEGKTLHQEEERRLFYVAMTRARDSLTIYARAGKGADPTPAGYLRDLLKDVKLKRWLCDRPARALQTDLFGEAVAPPVAGLSRTTEWLGLPPALDLSEKLSASAVQTYQTCPLQFKLEKEWRIPAEPSGALQYGGTMHRVLRAYYDSVIARREMSEEAVLEFFRTDLAQAGIQDRYQHELYEKQGIGQLQDFLSACQSVPVPEVLHAEEWFEVRLGETVVVGRIDRIDRAGDQGVVITDYKTGKPRTQEDADDSLQLSVYALAAREKWGYRADKLKFYNLEENSAVATTRSEAELEKAKGKLQDVAQKIAAREFRARPGFHCAFCAYRNLCPATEKRVYTTAKQ